MPPPAKTLVPAPPPAPVVSPAPATLPRPAVTGPVPQPAAGTVTPPAQSMVGNAAVAAALSGAPPGGGPTQMLLAGQPTSGNGAVAAAGGLAPPGPAALAPPPDSAPGPEGAPAPAVVRRGPHTDPKFVALKKDVRTKQRAVAASHPPAKAEAGAAQAAARPPADDREAQGKTANADKMDAAKPKEFDKAAFIRAVEEAIAKRSPKNLKEADEFGDSGKADEAKREVQGRVGEGKDASAAEIATTTAAPPDTSKAVDKQVVPLTPDKPPPVPGTPDPAAAVPDKLPPSVTDLSAGPRQLDQQMAGAQVTEPQLAKSNEPQFVDALGQKQAAKRDSGQAQARMRAHENATLAGATTDARQFGTAGMHDIAGTRMAAGRQVGAGKTGAKGRDEAKRAQVTATLQRVFDATKSDVEGILSGLDKKVDDQFSREEKQARDAFTAEHKRKMKEYKDKRYAGVAGKLRWFEDWLAGLPDEANQFYVEARDHYVARMRTVIANVADTIAGELNRAKRRIADGRAELQTTIKRLPADLRSIGQEAAADFADRFDELTQSVDDKGTELVDTLADKYTEALKSVDEEIAAEKEKNEGAIDKAAAAIKDTVKTIIELKNLLLGVLRKAAQAVMAIINDPIGFLRNLVASVGAGLKLFMRNIGRHLQAGLLAWLLGVSARAGIQLPAKFDVKGILLLIASLLGLTWPNIRARITRKVPEPAVVAAETAVPLVGKVKREGVGGLWDDIKGRIGDLKQTLISKVTSYLIPTVIIAGIMWVLSLLNPASAFVRACKLIIDIVRFIVERGQQVIEFVDAVLDAVIAIAKGGGGGVPALIEKALARSIPVLIGFLAAILGIGGIAGRVKKIFQELSKPVNKAVDWVIDKIVGLVKRLWAKLKAALERGRRRWSDRRRRRADRRRKDGRHRRDRKRDPADDSSPADERLALEAATIEATLLLTAEGATEKSVRRGLPKIKKRYRLTSIQLRTVTGGRYIIELAINPKSETRPESLEFPYKIQAPTAPVKTTKLQPVINNLRAVRIPMHGRDPVTGFVITVPATPDQVGADIAARYVDAAWEGSGAGEFATVRTAVVIGVNTFERLDPGDDAKGRGKVSTALGKIAQREGLLMAAFGFLWEPRWVHTEDGREASLADVRRAYQGLTDAAEKKRAVDDNEGRWRQEHKLPYGIFREEVFLSPYTQQAVRILSKINQQVYVVSQDPDTGVTAAGDMGFLAVYDEILRDAQNDPVLVFGGYHFEGFGWGADADPRTVQLTLLANRLDQAFRTAIGKVYPQMLYPIEQLTLIKVWERDTSRQLRLIFQDAQLLARLRASQGALYGIGAGEGRHLGEFLRRRHGVSLAYTPEVAISTDPLPDDPDRMYTITAAEVNAFAERRRYQDLPPNPVYAALMQSQSVAGAFKLASAFSQVRPIAEETRNDLRHKIFVHVEKVAELMAADPTLTIRSPEIRQRLARLDDDVRRLLQDASEGGGDRQVVKAVKTAHQVTRRIIKTMTANELRSVWMDLSRLLKEIRQDSPPSQGDR